MQQTGFSRGPYTLTPTATPSAVRGVRRHTFGHRYGYATHPYRITAREYQITPMAYLHDAFISYRRHAQWTPWVREKVKPLLDGYLSQELGRRGRYLCR